MSFVFQPSVFAVQQQQQQQQQPLPPPFYYIHNSFAVPAGNVVYPPTTYVLGPSVVAVPVVVIPRPVPLPAPISQLMISSPLIITSPLLIAPAPAPTATVRLPTLRLRIIFHNASNSHSSTPPLTHATDAAYPTAREPSRDALLSDILAWAGAHHGLAVEHEGGRISPSKAKLVILPATEETNEDCGSSSPPLSSLGLEIIPGAGVVIPGDCVKVLGLDTVGEDELMTAWEEVKTNKYSAFVVVDMNPDQPAQGPVADPDPDPDPDPVQNPATDPVTDPTQDPVADLDPN